MPSAPAVAVWSLWRLHADALVSVIGDEGIPVGFVEDPVAAPGLLVAGASLHDNTSLVEARRGDGRSTIIWGGTLPLQMISDLRAAGAAAYVTMLQSPDELAAVVRQVVAGEEVAWPTGPGVMPSLTPRERQVAEAYLVRWADHSRNEVAARLGVSERTLKVHIANIRAKAGHRGAATREGLRRSLTVREWID